MSQTISLLAQPVDIPGFASPTPDPTSSAPPEKKLGRPKIDYEGALLKMQREKQEVPKKVENVQPFPPQPEPPVTTTKRKPGRPPKEPKVAPPEPGSMPQPGVSDDFLDEDEIMDPELAAKKHELLAQFLISKDIYPNLTEKKIRNIKLLEVANRELELGQVRLIQQYNDSFTDYALKALNSVAAKNFKLSPNKYNQLQDKVENHKHLKVLTRFGLQTGILSKIPLFIKWAMLYGATLMEVVNGPEPSST